ncbi:MAG: hypothetical protein V2A74_11000 [bacterium]
MASLRNSLITLSLLMLLVIGAFGVYRSLPRAWEAETWVPQRLRVVHFDLIHDYPNLVQLFYATCIALPLLIWIFHRDEQRARRSIRISAHDGGRIFLEESALVRYLCHVVRKIPAVITVRARVKQSGVGVRVRLRAQVLALSTLPQIDEEIRRVSEDCLKRTFGIPDVKEIDVGVEDFRPPRRGKSPRPAGPPPAGKRRFPFWKKSKPPQTQDQVPETSAKSHAP